MPQHANANRDGYPNTDTNYHADGGTHSNTNRNADHPTADGGTHGNTNPAAANARTSAHLDATPATDCYTRADGNAPCAHSGDSVGANQGIYLYSACCPA